MADKPLNMTTRYFTIFPDDIIPVWTVSGVVMGRRARVVGDGRRGGVVVMGRRGGVVGDGRRGGVVGDGEEGRSGW